MMLFILSCCLLIISQISCSHDRLWYPQVLAPHGSHSATFLRSGNRQVGLRTYQWSSLEPETVHQVGKRVGSASFMISPLSDQILTVSDQLVSNNFELPMPAMNDNCYTQPTTILLEKQELDTLTGQLIRNCKGLVRVNRCEGFCDSAVQPSVKSPTGIKKKCFCCNEGAFKQIRVRLNECYSGIEDRLITRDDPEKSYMDIMLDEPVECKCRHCDGIF